MPEIIPQTDLIASADSLMKDLLDEARGSEKEGNDDFRLQVMAAFTKYLSVKHRIPGEEEPHGFDQFRNALTGGTVAAPRRGGGQRAARARAKAKGNGAATA